MATAAAAAAAAFNPVTFYAPQINNAAAQSPR